MFQPTSVARRGSLLLTTLLLVAVPLVVMPSEVAGSVSHAAQRWAGYAIPRTGRAAGGWIGGYRIGDTPIFLITPTRAPNRQGYQSVRVVDDLGGRGGPTRTETARAAWILSKYGGYRDAAQAAAVDASVYALLVGGRWSTNGARGAGRIYETPDWSTVRRFARIMLNQSRLHAGPYRARVAATNADVGGTIEATVVVTDGHGRPASGLPVTVTAAGAARSQAVTGDNGRAVVRFAASQPGWRRITATVGQVPEDRLHVRLPIRPGQAAAAEGGVRRTVVASTLAAVRGSQALSLTSRTPIDVGSAAQVTATVSGDGTARSAIGTLYGPAASASATKCAGHSVGTVRMTVRADGDYTLPALTPDAPGYYIWHVALAGTPTALPVSACQAVTTVRAVPTVSVTVLNPDMKAADNTNVRVTLSGLPTTPPVDVTVNMYGPYATQQALSCSSAAKTLVPTMNGGTTVTLPFYVGQAGWYVFQASVPAGDLHEGAQSPCAGLGTVLHLQLP